MHKRFKPANGRVYCLFLLRIGGQRKLLLEWDSKSLPVACFPNWSFGQTVLVSIAGYILVRFFVCRRNLVASGWSGEGAGGSPDDGRLDTKWVEIQIPSPWMIYSGFRMGLVSGLTRIME